MKNLFLLIVYALIVISCSKEIIIPQYTLSVSSNPLDGGSSNPSNGIYAYDEGALVSISAKPNQNFKFLKWTGTVNTTDNPVEIEMKANAFLIAEFSLIPIFKNYKQSSILLRKSNLWLDYHKVASSNGSRNIQGLAYDCPNAIADFNGDGFDDILMAPTAINNFEDKRLEIELFVNDKSNNNFVLDNSLIKNNLGTKWARKAIVGDYNGDGKPDVVFAEQGVDVPPYPLSEQSILLSNDEGYTMKLISSEKWFGHGVTSGDFDNDGDLDIFFTHPFKLKDYLFENDGKANFTLRNDLTNFNSTQSYTCEFFDINRDGNLDLFVGGHNRPNSVSSGEFPARIFFGNGKDFTDNRKFDIPSIHKWNIVLDFNFYDLDQDGIEEIIINRTQDIDGKTYNGFQIQILKNVNGEFKDFTKNFIMDYLDEEDLWIVWLRVEDIDKNGKVDIFDSDKSHRGTGKFLRWEQDSDGIFKRVTP